MSNPVDDADRIEQDQAVTDQVGPATPARDDVDEADAVEQRAAVPLDEDDARR
ncbi:hypothetical protein [Modestobacter sp. Leaf380]|uniref:hypothetical protein n=1 Tax=Modestobacter sp. Leaf380 TaxID=1736356 RepID=UPI0019107393|nr:hypothetical protein [Modestobacter sp. Leaf380]